MFRFQDIQVFAFLNTPRFTKSYDIMMSISKIGNEHL